MRLTILILPFLLLAANQASAEHDRHHRSVPRVTGEMRLETPAIPQPVAVSEAVVTGLPAQSAPKPERPRVRVVLPSPFAQ